MKRTRSVIILLMALAIAAQGCGPGFVKFKDAFKGLGQKERSGGIPRKVKKELKNGMTVVVEENFGAPVVAVQVWVNVGSGDETAPDAGISHQLEHMMFKGTEQHRLGKMAQIVESLGGDLNAFTSYDNTVYHITIASRYFDRAVGLLADQVRNSTIDADELAKEKEVVREEIRRGKDSPGSRVYKYLFAESYLKHPYGRPVIGFDETVAAFTPDQVKSFYKRWYVPKNMTLVVAGNVKAEVVMAAAQKSFGDMKGDAPPPKSSTPRSVPEPPGTAPKAKVHYEDVSESYLYLSYHIPEYGHEDMAALDVLSVIMGSGESSRLKYRISTERRLADRIFALAYTPIDPGLFIVGSDLEAAKADEALEMTLKQMDLVKHEPVADWELAKAKLTLETDYIFAKETVDGQARRLGYFVTYTGDPDFEKKYLDQIRAVTPEDLMRVARTYFTSANLTVSAIVPERAREGKGKKKDHAFDEAKVLATVRAVDAWDAKFTPKSLVELKPITPPVVPTVEPTPSSRGASYAKAPQMFTLGNGARLIVRENYSVPLVAVNAIFEAGVRRENEATNGINNLIARTMTEGTANYSSSQIHSTMESRGGGIFGFSGRNSLGVSMEVPSAYFRACLPIFTDVLRYPTFPDDQVSRMQGIVLSSIRAQSDHPAQLVNKLLRTELFKEHPYRLDPLGTEASVKRLTSSDLQNYYENFAVPSNLVIAVVGDVTAEEVRRDFEELMKDWVADRYRPAPVPTEPAPDAPREAPICRDVNQTNILVGFQGATINSRDRYSLHVLSEVLSGMSGRLFTKLRGEQSLAYSVYAFSEEGLDPGVFGVYIGTAPEKEDASRKGIIAELSLVRDQPIGKDELTRAQEMLIGDFEIKLQRYGAQAMQYAVDELYGLGFRDSDDYARKVQEVTVRDVQNAARKYIRPDAPVIAIVRPCEPKLTSSSGPPADAGPAAYSADAP
jgi:zinc protease